MILSSFIDEKYSRLIAVYTCSEDNRPSISKIIMTGIIFVAHKTVCYFISKVVQ